MGASAILVRTRERFMKRNWAAAALAFVMALIGIVLAIGGACQPVEACRRRHGAWRAVRRSKFRDPRRERRHCRTRASGAERARDDRSFGSVDRCRLAGLWRHQRGLALLASDADQRFECRP